MDSTGICENCGEEFRRRRWTQEYCKKACARAAGTSPRLCPPDPTPLVLKHALRDGKKICRKCKLPKTADAFSDNRSEYDGLQNACKDCQRNGRADLAEKRPRRRGVVERIVHTFNEIVRYDLLDTRSVRLARRALCEAQDGLCGICLRWIPVDQDALDHSHETGYVRGLLCDGCNKGLGFFGDDPERLEAAARYIREDRRIRAGELGDEFLFLAAKGYDRREAMRQFFRDEGRE